MKKSFIILGIFSLSVGIFLNIYCNNDNKTSLKEKKGIEEFVSMRNSELDLLGGRRKLVMSGQLDNDDDFDNLCVIQHLYQFSEVTLKEIKKQWKRFKWKKASSPYLELTRREPHKGNLGSRKIDV